eukprot:TRINITY_DN71471_c0_g1_i1.p1 TRINITY_DN71471_c0_g1~~TRINITY_DN71471_c0_g1_i1.p1  ORF type:complete len:289 (+),score=61.80 TRINITY_DN71471_c0_g1_i1:28-894(+)
MAPPSSAASLFNVSEDRFGGVNVSLNEDLSAQADPIEWEAHLSRELEAWRARGIRGVWLRVPRKLAQLVAPAVRLGFDFHHAQPGYVMLTHWLPGGQSSLPAFPHHQVGVGGMVLDSSGSRVLCIQERAGLTAGMKDFWKLPGGLVDPAEDLCDAAVREVLEETGVVTVFECVATVRESHAGPFGSTDLYVICLLRLHESYGDTLPSPSPQEKEIAAAEWRDLKGFLESRYYAKGLYGSLLKTAASVALRRNKGEVNLGIERTQMKGLGGKTESMYFAGGEALTRARL